MNLNLCISILIPSVVSTLCAKALFKLSITLRNLGLGYKIKDSCMFGRKRRLWLGMQFSLHASSALKGMTFRLVNVAKIFVAVSHIDSFFQKG